ncbi:MAG: IucA/IucC family protein [Stackebrandtia sp.]
MTPSPAEDAATHITRSLLAAAWRENLNNLRTHASIIPADDASEHTPSTTPDSTREDPERPAPTVTGAAPCHASTSRNSGSATTADKGTGDDADSTQSGKNTGCPAPAKVENTGRMTAVDGAGTSARTTPSEEPGQRTRTVTGHVYGLSVDEAPHPSAPTATGEASAGRDISDTDRGAGPTMPGADISASGIRNGPETSAGWPTDARDDISGSGLVPPHGTGITIHIDVAGGTLHVDADAKAFGQIEPTGPIRLSPDPSATVTARIDPIGSKESDGERGQSAAATDDPEPKAGQSASAAVHRASAAGTGRHSINTAANETGPVSTDTPPQTVPVADGVGSASANDVGAGRRSTATAANEADLGPDRTPTHPAPPDADDGGRVDRGPADGPDSAADQRRPGEAGNDGERPKSGGSNGRGGQGTPTCSGPATGRHRTGADGDDGGLPGSGDEGARRPSTGSDVAGRRRVVDAEVGGGGLAGAETVVDDPVGLLRLLVPDAPGHLAAELRDAVTGLTTALPRHRDLNQSIRDTASRHGASTTVELVETLTAREPGFLPCRFFEPLAVEGHHLHPCARTRLGWDEADRRSYDLEAPRPIAMRFVAARRDIIASAPDGQGRDLGTRLAERYPFLREHLDPDSVLIPVHPWQHHSIRSGGLRHLFGAGLLRDLPARMDTAPTASIRTLVAADGAYLKCSLSIHITSTLRGISPATVHNGPVLSRLLSAIIPADPDLAPRIAVLPEPAGASLPDGHPAARQLSCLLRVSLSEVTQPGELPIPATALAAISPVTGSSIAAELVAATGRPPDDFLHRYTRLLAGVTIRLADRYGIAAEAHLQNCVPTFTSGEPRRIIIRDLGGARILPGRLADAGHRPDLHPRSVITTTDADTVRAKVAYTVFQNHLAAVIDALSRDCALPQATAWRIVADTLDTIDMSTPDRDFYTAATVPHKALLSMRLRAGTGDVHVPVLNPLARP